VAGLRWLLSAAALRSLHCIALHCIALHCIALHCIASHRIALHCSTYWPADVSAVPVHACVFLHEEEAVRMDVS
jgi:hypothetical protein